MSDDWDTKLVIGSKAKAPKVTRNTSDLNGTCLVSNLPDPPHRSSSGTLCRNRLEEFHSDLFVQARRVGAVVATDKKVTAGGNKAHQGKPFV
jgi:putative transcription factor